MITKTISCVGEKGGVGKSTLNIILATNLVHHFNKSVVLIDLDDPQYSLYSKRLRELRIFEVEEKDVPYHIVKSTIKDLRDNVAFYNEKVDFIIIDFPGSLSKETALGLHYVEHVFVPFTLDEFEVDSTVKFYRNSIKYFVDNPDSMMSTIQVFFNKYAKKKKRKFQDLQNTMNKFKVPMMQNVVLERTIYREDYRSTIIPIPENKENGEFEFLHFMREVIKTSK